MADSTFARLVGVERFTQCAVGNAGLFKNFPFGLVAEPKIEGEGCELRVEREAIDALLARPALDRFHQGPAHPALSIARIDGDAFGFDGVAQPSRPGGSDGAVGR